jgi:hypothetical protein
LPGDQATTIVAGCHTVDRSGARNAVIKIPTTFLSR